MYLLIFLTDLRRQNRSDLTADSQKIAKNQVEPKESSKESSDESDNDDISEQGLPLPKVGTL